MVKNFEATGKDTIDPKVKYFTVVIPAKAGHEVKL